ncbi:MAG TPA: hypothetical protein VFN30_11830 [Chitinophagaceae bacterium]|nr:hypothetical protein [Chitinophagaceae bacterium]
MKHPILFILTTLLFGTASAQVRIQIVGVNPKPTSRLSDWTINKNIFSVFATDASGLPETRVKFKVEIKDQSGAVIGSTNLATSPIFTIKSGTANIFSAGDVLALPAMQFTGSAKIALAKTGRLPGGNYELCIRAVNSIDFTPVSEIYCINFMVTSYQLPLLMFPANESEVEPVAAKTAIIFRWTPIVPTPTEAISYRLQVFEVMEKQTPLQAFRANQPLLDKEIKGVTQYVWQPQLDFSCCGDDDAKAKKETKQDSIEPDTDLNTWMKQGRAFIWTIQTIDAANNGFNNGVGDGRSEPFIFFVRKKKK